MGLFVHLHRKQRSKQRSAISELPTAAQANEAPAAPLAHEKYSSMHAYEKDTDRLHEMDSGEQRGELAGSASEDRDRKIEQLVANSGKT